MKKKEENGTKETKKGKKKSTRNKRSPKTGPHDLIMKFD
jgi:hypothetical protein